VIVSTKIITIHNNNFFLSPFYYISTVTHCFLDYSIGSLEPPTTAAPAGSGKYQHPNAKNTTLGGSGGIDPRRRGK
jgi:hypothetical protein